MTRSTSISYLQVPLHDYYHKMATSSPSTEKDELKLQVAKLLSSGEFLQCVSENVAELILKRISATAATVSYEEKLAMYHEPKSLVRDHSFISFTDLHKPGQNVIFQLPGIQGRRRPIEIVLLPRGSFTVEVLFCIGTEDSDQESIALLCQYLLVNDIQTTEDHLPLLGEYSFVATGSCACKWWQLIRKDNRFLGHADTVAKAIDNFITQKITPLSSLIVE